MTLEFLVNLVVKAHANAQPDYLLHGKAAIDRNLICPCFVTGVDKWWSTLDILCTTYSQNGYNWEKEKCIINSAMEIEDELFLCMEIAQGRYET